VKENKIKIPMPRILSRAIREDAKVATYTEQWLLRFQEIICMNAIENHLSEKHREIVRIFPEHRKNDLADLDRVIRYLRRKNPPKIKGGNSRLSDAWCVYVKASAHAAVDAQLVVHKISNKNA